MTTATKTLTAEEIFTAAERIATSEKAHKALNAIRNCANAGDNQPECIQAWFETGDGQLLYALRAAEKGDAVVFLGHLREYVSYA